MDREASSAEYLKSVLELCALSSLHCRYRVLDLMRLIVPPIELRQCAVWRADDRPIGFATWAFLSEDAHEWIINAARKIQPEDWRSGEHIWLIDAAAPYGHAAQMMRALRRESGLKGKTVNFIRRYSERRPARYGKVVI